MKEDELKKFNNNLLSINSKEDWEDFLSLVKDIHENIPPAKDINVESMCYGYTRQHLSKNIIDMESMLNNYQFSDKEDFLKVSRRIIAQIRLIRSQVDDEIFQRYQRHEQIFDT